MSMGYVNYEKVANGAFNGDAYVLEHTHIPQKASDIPYVIGLTAPARSGTTAFLLLMASQPWVDHAYFQPQKSLIRTGHPDYTLSAKDKIVFAKETLGVLYPYEDFDPIAHLLAKGVPADKIIWITMLREPVHTFASWRYHVEGVTPEGFAKTQQHAIDLYNQHKHEVHSIPVVYELFAENPQRTLKAMFRNTPYQDKDFVLDFDVEAIQSKISLGQAEDPVYYEKMISPVIAKKGFQYIGQNRQITEDDKRAIHISCTNKYDDFEALARQYLGLI